MNVRTTIVAVATLGLLGSAVGLAAQAPATNQSTQTSASASPAATAAAPVAAAKGKKDKAAYSGPNTIVVLPATPMLDAEGKQMVDPDGKPMFNPPVRQLRDKKGHPVFDSNSKPVFQTATNLGYDEHGKKIPVQKVKPPKMTPMSISAGTLTVDGWTGKARLNYDIADLKFLYIYAPGIGTTIVATSAFPGAKEQAGAFNGATLHVTADGHAMELTSEKRLLGKKPESAWVAVDRGFMLPAKFPEFGYGTATRAPYAWPGAKNVADAKGAVEAPPLPKDLQPALLLAPCPVGMMRAPGAAALPGQKVEASQCVPIATPPTSAPIPAANAATRASPAAK